MPILFNLIKNMGSKFLYKNHASICSKVGNVMLTYKLSKKM